MKKTNLIDGTLVNCISSTEAQMLHEHINGYLNDIVKISDGDTVIDIGANIGIFGFVLSKLFKKITIHSFEPINEIYSVLKANSILSKNGNFKVYSHGISNENHIIDFTYYPNSPALSTSYPEIWNSEKDLMEALKGNLKHSPKNWWWAKYIPSFIYPLILKNLRRNSKKIKCELKTLSYVIEKLQIEKINLLKIDCEGNELKVLEGLDGKNWPIIEQLIIEVHDIENRLNIILDLLKEKNYTVKVIKEPSLNKTNLHNIFAVKNITTT